MYAKVFRQIYDSTLAEDWRSLVTFQQLLVLADSDGVVDMTPSAIHRITNIPKDIIDAGIEKLQQPDPVSRSSTEDGKRIIPIDSDRPWGWRIVNYEYYRNLASREDKREKDRQRIADKRKTSIESDVSQSVAECRSESLEVANVAYTEAEANTDTDTNKKQKKVASLPTWLPKELWNEYKEHRRKLKAPLTDYAEYLELKELTKLRDAGNDPEKVINKTIQKGWKGLFELKGKPDKPAVKPKDFPSQ